MAAVTTATTASPFIKDIEPITERKDDLRAILLEAELPPLLPALAYLTGDMSLLRPELRPDPLLLGMPQGGLTDEQQREVRERALATLIAYRDGGCRQAEPPDDADLLRIPEFAAGGTDMS